MDSWVLTDGQPLRNCVRDYAVSCLWRAGASLACDMAEGRLTTGSGVATVEGERCVWVLHGARQTTTWRGV